MVGCQTCHLIPVVDGMPVMDHARRLNIGKHIFRLSIMLLFCETKEKLKTVILWFCQDSFKVLGHQIDVAFVDMYVWIDLRRIASGIYFFRASSYFPIFH